MRPVREIAPGVGSLVNTGTCRRGVTRLTVPNAPASSGEVDPGEPAACGARSEATSRRVARACVPRYVQRCPHRTEYQRAIPYQLLLWPPGNPRAATRVVAHCRSWRCEGACRRHEASVAWRRITDALEPHDEKHVLFAVLTIDQDGYYSGVRWADSTQAYRALADMMSAWLKRLNRMLEREGLEKIESRWVSVIEQHRSGWPHCNVVIVSAGLAELVRRERAAMPENLRDHRCGPRRPGKRCELCRQRALVRGPIAEATTGVGFGLVSSIEQAESRGAVAGYLCKLAGLQDEPGTPESRSAPVTGEVTKLSQVPTAAPQGFRRLRSGIRFLPPRQRGLMRGALLDEGAPVKAPRAATLRRRDRLITRAAELRGQVSGARLARLDGLLERLRAQQHAELSRVAELSTALEAVGLPHDYLARRLSSFGHWRATPRLCAATGPPTCLGPAGAEPSQASSSSSSSSSTPSSTGPGSPQLPAARLRVAPTV